MEQLYTHYLRGELFENFVITEYMKYRANRQAGVEYFFWKDQGGHEVDLLVETPQAVSAIEIKAGKTVAEDYVKALEYLRSVYVTEGQTFHPLVIYGGDLDQARRGIPIYSWRRMLVFV